MKPSALSQAGWVLFGGTLVLLIGALVKFVPESAPAKTAAVVAETSTSDATNMTDDSVDATNDVPLPPNFPANLAQVVKLTRAGLREDVVLGYVTSSGEHYDPTADEMIYLHQSGVSEAVMAALVKQKQKAAPMPPAALEAPIANVAPSNEMVEDDAANRSVPSLPSANPETSPAPPQRPAAGAASYFYDDLAPYGDWVENSDSNWAWKPTVQQAVPNWQPYRDDGQWEYSDAGWYWQSSYPWGWAAFHYGGWYNDPTHGWLWQPGNTWAPAWVVWRKTPSHYGWAPLPPGVSFNAAFAVQPNNYMDYGLTPSSYTFVPVTHFLSHNLTKFAAPASKSASLLANSVPASKARNAGMSADEVAAVTHRQITRLKLNDAAAPTSRGPEMRSQELAVYRPNPAAASGSRQDGSALKANR
jgi:hypothetical protein